MRLSAAGTRIGDVRFCPTPDGAAAYADAVGSHSPDSGFCLAPYPFGPTLDGVDADALSIDFDTGFLVSCSFEIERPLRVDEAVRVTVDVDDVRPRAKGEGAVATILVQFHVDGEVIGRHRYVFVDGVVEDSDLEVDCRGA